MRDRSYEDQMHRVSGLNLICAAISLWNTTYIETGPFRHYATKEST